MPKRKSQPTTLADIMEPGDGDIIEVPCDGENCEHTVEWPARSRGLLDTLRAEGLPVYCDDCTQRETDAAAAREARAAQQRFVEGQRRRSGIPAKWAAQDFDSIEADRQRAPAISAAAEWALGIRKRGLLFTGDIGRGKTAIAAAAANGRLSRGEAVRWLPVGELLMDLRMPFDSPEYVRAQRALDARTALVLDDLDKVRPSDHAREPIYVAVNAWVEAEMPLIVTMNRSLLELADEFGDRYGDAIASRLAGYCEEFEVGGRDRRVA
jgi:DNA replication protein DnaC